MNKIIIFLISIFLVSCQSAPREDVIQTAIAQTNTAQAALNTPTSLPPTPTPTSIPTLTPIPLPTDTPQPSPTQPPAATPTKLIELNKVKAQNWLASQDTGNVTVEIARIDILDRKSLNANFGAEIIDEKQTVIRITFRITNHNEKTVDFYPDQGLVSIDGEQIDMFDFVRAGLRTGDDLGGEYLPGAIIIGTIYLGIDRTPWDQVSSIIIKIGSPRVDLLPIGQDLLFDIAVTDWDFPPIPDELK